MFDTQDCIEEEDEEDEENQILDEEEDPNANVREGKRALNASGGGRNPQGSSAHRHQDPEAGIEMQVRTEHLLLFFECS